MIYCHLWSWTVSGRVRVAVRLRPRNAEELVADADFADCVELQPEVLIVNLYNIASSFSLKSNHMTLSSLYLYSVFIMINIFINFFRSQVKRLKLRKNNWDSDTYEFDEVLTEFASQKRVYEVVAKPVVEVCSVSR